MSAKKKALCVGINYAGTEFELRGCINDADDWADFFQKNGFSTSVLTEAQATKSIMLHAMTDLIADLKAGDVGVITYSGHGTWVPDQDGDEPDGRDEALCPIDMGDDGHNLILDDELHLLFNKIVKGAHVIFVTDSCFSGSVYRFFDGSFGQRKVRFIPPSHILKDATLITRMNLGFGQPQSKKNQSPLPGLLHLSGCTDHEYSNDAYIDGRFNGALTYFAVRAFANTLRHKGTYQDAWLAIRKSLPSWEFQQTPLLNAPADLKKVRLLG